MIELHDGTLLDPLNPRPNQYKLENMFEAACKMPRFGANYKQKGMEINYKLIHHSLAVYFEGEYRGLDEEDLKLCLMHDMAEACLGVDMVTPLKQYCDNFKLIEKIHQAAIYCKYGINGSDLELKPVDYDVAVYESRFYMVSAGDEYRWDNPRYELPKSYKVKELIETPWTYEYCKIIFFELCKQLGIKDD